MNRQTRMIRLVALLTRLAHLRWVPIDELCEQFEIDRRTVNRDIQMIRELGIDVQREDARIRMTSGGRERLGQLMMEGTPQPPSPQLI